MASPSQGVVPAAALDLAPLGLHPEEVRLVELPARVLDIIAACLHHSAHSTLKMLCPSSRLPGSKGGFAEPVAVVQVEKLEGAPHATCVSPLAQAKVEVRVEVAGATASKLAEDGAANAFGPEPLTQPEVCSPPAAAASATESRAPASLSVEQAPSPADDGSKVSKSSCLTRWPDKLPLALEQRFSVAQGGDPLGEGSLAVVHRVHDRGDGRPFALKVMEKHPLLIRNLGTQARREISFQSAIQHPNVLRLNEFMEDETHIYMLLEFASGGGLTGFLQQHPGNRLQDEAAAWLFAQIVEGVGYMHSVGCIHRDLKPDNILLGDGCCPKISDFGWCAEVGDGALRKTMCGTVHYMAPEVLLSEGHNLPADLWSLGVLLYEFLAGHSPFAWSTTSADLADKVSKVEYPFPPWFAHEACHLVHCLMQRHPPHRWASPYVLQHPWITKHYMDPKRVGQQPSSSDSAAQRFECVEPTNTESPHAASLPRELQAQAV
mmetsp:Transcript_66640/g.167956  ORF Transcript_66640/g.167956 Transcript_66640/m.167956 type:complete len:491 (+) Transcript_66640:109-1581(+)